MKAKIIYLAGFMGSGKSTIGPIVANSLGWDFADLDKVIENKLNKKIGSIFAEKGEREFRILEREILKEISLSENMIISLGGGTIVDQKNIDFMKSKGKIIFLEASPESFYRRLRFKNDRPVIKNENDETLPQEELKDRITNLLNYRGKFYNQADLKIQTDGVSIGKTVDRLVKIITRDL
jgi:shikimate kinase